MSYIPYYYYLKWIKLLIVNKIINKKILKKNLFWMEFWHTRCCEWLEIQIFERDHETQACYESWKRWRDWKLKLNIRAFEMKKNKKTIKFFGYIRRCLPLRWDGWILPLWERWEGWLGRYGKKLICQYQLSM